MGPGISDSHRETETFKGKLNAGALFGGNIGERQRGI